MATSKTAQLEQIAAEIIEHNVCPDLAQSATQLVLGEGNPDANIVFIGEAPGKKEDELGRPFVGASGTFLDEMLASIGLERGDVYITNIVKYRPPNNRDPLPAEKAEFLPYLHQQLEIIQPALVVTLGRHSMDAVVPGKLKISVDHGRAVHHEGRVYLPLYHPAAALYNGGMRQTLLDDFAQIPQLLTKFKQ